MEPSRLPKQMVEFNKSRSRTKTAVPTDTVEPMIR